MHNISYQSSKFRSDSGSSPVVLCAHCRMTTDTSREAVQLEDKHLLSGFTETNMFDIQCRSDSLAVFSTPQILWCVFFLKYTLGFLGFKKHSRNVSYIAATVGPPRAIIQQRELISFSKDKNSCRDKLLLYHRTLQRNNSKLISAAVQHELVFYPRSLKHVRGM